MNRCGLLLLTLALPGCILTSTVRAELCLGDVPPQELGASVLPSPGGGRCVRVEQRVTGDDGATTTTHVFDAPSDTISAETTGFLTASCIHEVGLARHRERVLRGSEVRAFDGKAWRVLGLVDPVITERPLACRIVGWVLAPFAMAADAVLFPVELLVLWSPLANELH